MATTIASPRVDDHFENRPAVLRNAYDAVLAASRRFGPVKVEPKKTSIHLVRVSAFAGVAVRKATIVRGTPAEAVLPVPTALARGGNPDSPAQ